jgi:TusA-related sulfurtransferase
MCLIARVPTVLLDQGDPLAEDDEETPTMAGRVVRSSGTHRFDAGDLGCADGLASEFRRQIGGIPIGDVLVVTARDPAAKEELPALARLMGHEVRSIESPGDGRLQIGIERRR